MQTASHDRSHVLVHVAIAAVCALAGMSADAASTPTVHTVVIEAMQFSPATLEVHAGDTVVWKNKDPFPHTATSERKPDFDSGEIEAARSWRYVAKQRGTFSYDCTLHPTMKGVLIVK